jgi:hypothetical protein
MHLKEICSEVQNLTHFLRNTLFLQDDSRASLEAMKKKKAEQKKNKRSHGVVSTKTVPERVSSKNTTERVRTPELSTSAPQSGDQVLSFDRTLDDISEISEQRPAPVQPMPPDPSD